MIHCKCLSKKINGISLFEEVSFFLQKGQKAALLGRNGSGKSTLLKILAEQEDYDYGEILLPKGYRWGWLRQHLYLSESTVIDEALKFDLQKRTYLAETFLLGLGFTKLDFLKSPKELSGGFQLRLHLCQILLSEPDGLLLDEPTNYLDFPSLNWLKHFLIKWKGEILLISHDRGFLDAICDSCIGIHRKKGRQVKGDTFHYYATLQEEEEVYEKARIKIERKKEHLRSFVDRFGAKATKAKQAKSKQKAINKLGSLEALVQLQSLNFYFPELEFPAKVMLEAKSLSFDYDLSSEVPLISKFSFSLEKGKKIAVIGKNGRGKSTLIKLLSGQLEPLQGELKKHPKVVSALFSQSLADTLNHSWSIEDELKIQAPHLCDEEIREICGKMLFSSDLAKKPLNVLSGGEKCRVLLAKILSSPINLLFLDEPTHHLDIESVEALRNAIDSFEGAVFLVSHSQHFIQSLSIDQLIIFKRGSIEFAFPLDCQNDFDTYFLESETGESISLVQEENKLSKQNRVASKELQKLQKQVKRLEEDWIEEQIVLEKLQNQLSLCYLNPSNKQKADELLAEVKQYQHSSDARQLEIQILYKKIQNLMSMGLE